MTSYVVLRMNNYRSQEDRWSSQAILDPTGRECFMVRMRVAKGFWKREGEAPSAVKIKDPITEAHEDPWPCLAVIIGRVLEKVVRTAKLKEPSNHQMSAWYFFH